MNDRKSATREYGPYAQQAMAAFGKMREGLNLRHVAQKAVGVHEVVVESYFARHSNAADAMLLTARLS